MRFKSVCALYLYKAVTFLASPFALWFLIRKKRRDPPYGRRKWELLGFVPVIFRRTIWFHAVSVGEIIAAKPVIERFVSYHPHLNVLVTTTTTTGAAIAANLKGTTHLFAPLDSPCAVRRFFKAVRPSHIFIMETELWPNLLDEARRHRVNVTVFNARMPEKTCLKYERHLTLSQDLIAAPLTMVLCQSEADKERFVRIGLPEEKVQVAGSLKYDLNPDEDKFKKARALKEERHFAPVMGAFSTHDGEEEQILETFFTVKKEFPDFKLVLVPRHQSGTDKACSFLDSIKEPYLRRSLCQDLKFMEVSVLIGDTFGEIEFYLGLCDFVFMGGSFVDIGGHNPLEPAYFSIPILTGPHYYNFTEQYEKLIDVEGAFLAGDNKRLYTLIKMFLNDPDLILRSGVSAMEVQQQGRGALDRTVLLIEKALRR